MCRHASFVAIAGLLCAGACTHTARTVILDPNPEVRAAAPASTAVTLGIPPGHLPEAGECRVWIPGTPPGRQPKPKSRPCPGIATVAPAGSWIVYRPTADRKLIHVREVDPRRAGVVVRIRVFDLETNRLVREEHP